MCVVTLLPLPGGFVLTSNRDEHISRPRATQPQTYQVNHQLVIFPKDPQGGGTWLATSGPTTVCLLNGAFLDQPNELVFKGGPRKSRGLVVLDYFGYATPRQFADRYDFSSIEPFTLLVVENIPGSLTIYELRWNGHQVYLRPISNNQPHIWSSVTLYTMPTAELRKSWLADFLRQHPSYTAAELFAFHQSAGDGNPDHDFVMNRADGPAGGEPNPRDGVRTVSITQITNSKTELTVRYRDLISGDETTVSPSQWLNSR
ncbi:NRDE family protein [Spirosoma soli]|uniref:NRDE family protein n=1 Tax=Spirosoma soli TaxID=1770529 RepID=A0ABW5MDG5_9BACT